MRRRFALFAFAKSFNELQMYKITHVITALITVLYPL